MNCIGCGKEHSPGTVFCQDCKLPLREAKCQEKVVRAIDPTALPAWRAPDVCACCLAPSERTQHRKVQFYAVRSGFTRSVVFSMRVDWCRACLKIERVNQALAFIQFLLALVVGLPLGLGLAYVVETFVLQWDKTLTSAGGMIIFFTGFIAAALFWFAMGQLFDRRFRKTQPGHVAFCRAVHVIAPGPDGARDPKVPIEIRFGSRAYAKRWSELNPS